MQPKPLLAQLVAAAGSVLLLLLVLEFGVWAWLTYFANMDTVRRFGTPAQFETRIDRDDDIRVRAPEEAKLAFLPHRYLGYAGQPNYRFRDNYHNSEGYRGDPFPEEKPAGEFRIVCVGGSTTYTTKVPNPKNAYPARLEAALRTAGFDNVRVINAGAPGYSSYETLINFQFRLVELDPDMLIVYHGINDAVARLVYPSNAYRGDNSGYVLHAPGTWIPTWYERSHALRTALILLRRTASPLTIEETLERPAPSRLIDKLRQQLRQDVFPAGLFQNAPLESIFRNNPPVYFRRNLEHLLVLARHHQIDVVLCTFKMSNAYTRVSALPEMVAAIDEQNAILHQLGQTFKVPVYDLADVFPNSRDYFADGVHVTPKGADLKARLIANFLIDHDLIPQHGS